MAYERGRTDYGAIVAEAADPAVKAVEVSEEEFDEMLGMMPPIYVPGGFLVCEAVSGDVFAMYAERDGRFFGKYVVKGRRETYIA